ncbi:MAG TPA: hypothetical protein VFB49_01070, partial [Patescibacteria group bacterium]|nr:hypothetical protein [Patescibacteria group bacterium]
MTRSNPIRIALLLPLLLLAVPGAAGAAQPSGPVFVARFGTDPLAGSIFQPEGDVVSRFTWIGKERPHFAGDRPGTLRVLYDTTLPTGRLSAPLGTVLS